MVLSTEEKKGIISEFGRSDKDSGSPEVQIGLLTARIQELTEHLKKHKKDYDTRRSLLVLVNRRSRFLKYLKSKDTSAYREIVKKLNIRK